MGREITTCPVCGRTPCASCRLEAARRVIAIRGSSDVPGFEANVNAEMEEMAAELNVAMVNDGV